MADDKPIRPATLFQGEKMRCIMCNKVQRSDPEVNSDWTAIEFEGKTYYVCPGELPFEKAQAGTATEDDFKEAYAKIFSRITALKNARRTSR